MTSTFDKVGAERSRMRAGIRYISAVEYIRLLRDDDMVPVASDLSPTETMLRFGQLAANFGRTRTEPVKLVHPKFGTVNGWPMYVWDHAWEKMTDRYFIRWVDETDPELTNLTGRYATRSGAVPLVTAGALLLRGDALAKVAKVIVQRLHVGYSTVENRARVIELLIELAGATWSEAVEAMDLAFPRACEKCGTKHGEVRR